MKGTVVLLFIVYHRADAAILSPSSRPMAAASNAGAVRPSSVKPAIIRIAIVIPLTVNRTFVVRIVPSRNVEFIDHALLWGAGSEAGQ
jgi:hypothetical protein